MPRITITVWDWQTRIFHWSLAALVFWCAISGFFLPAFWLHSHVQAGTAVGGLVILRLIWGLWGNHYSRFSSFPFSPVLLVRHTLALCRGQSLHMTGHPPLGALMVVALLLLLTAIGLTGAMTLGAFDRLGPFAADFSFASGRKFHRLHHLFALLLMVCVALHVAGVLAECRLMRKNLIAIMLHGRDDIRIAKDKQPDLIRPNWMYAVAAVVFLLDGAGLTLYLMAQRPPAGWHPLDAISPAYIKECGACHELYHPSLRNRDGWIALIAHLDSHFGEDASLPLETTADIANWLVDNSAEHWDTKASNGVGRSLDPDHPGSVTASPWWKWKHQNLPRQFFKLQSVGRPSHCTACHHDALDGIFSGLHLSLPSDAGSAVLLSGSH